MDSEQLEKSYLKSVRNKKSQTLFVQTEIGKKWN